MIQRQPGEIYVAIGDGAQSEVTGQFLEDATGFRERVQFMAQYKKTLDSDL